MTSMLSGAINNANLMTTLQRTRLSCHAHTRPISMVTHGRANALVVGKFWGMMPIVCESTQVFICLDKREYASIEDILKCNVSISIKHMTLEKTLQINQNTRALQSSSLMYL